MNPACRPILRVLLHRLAGLILAVALVGVRRRSRACSHGVTVTDLGNPFVRIARGVENAARRLAGPEVKVFVASSAYDIARQNEQIDSFIRKQRRLDHAHRRRLGAIEPAVRRAQAEGIRVIALDVRAAGADATFTTDNVQAGELACRHIVQRLNGKGDVVISGPPVSAIVDRLAGCAAAFSAAPGIRVLRLTATAAAARKAASPR